MIKLCIILLLMTNIYAGGFPSKERREEARDSTPLLTKSHSEITLNFNQSVDDEVKYDKINKDSILEFLSDTYFLQLKHNIHFILKVDDKGINGNTIITGSLNNGSQLIYEYTMQYYRYKTEDNKKTLMIVMKNKEKEDEKLIFNIQFDRPETN